jgi:uncharacterized phage protein gp47/JayE
MAELIQPPSLDVRSVERIAAEGYALITGALTVERIESRIETLRELRAIVEAGGLPAEPLCKELTNSNPGAAHGPIIEAMALMVGILARKVDALPVRDAIAFHQLFGIELRDPTPATATLLFTSNAPPGLGATIPAGTLVSTSDGETVFATDVLLNIPTGVTTGTVTATAVEAGALALAPNTLTVVRQTLSWVASVTNVEAVESGSDAESLTSALARARNYQVRGERLVSSSDVADAILNEVMGGSGIVAAFDLVAPGAFETPLAGNTTVVVMTASGAPVSSSVKAAIAELLEQRVGNQFIWIADPTFVDFEVSATVQLESLVPQDVVLASVRSRLADFYSAAAARFGRDVLISEIVSIIEETDGVDHIVASGSQLLSSPLVDISVPPYAIARLLAVEDVLINVAA